MEETASAPDVIQPDHTVTGSNGADKSSVSQAGKQGSKGGLPANQSRVGQQTDSISDGNGKQVAWDALEESARAVGIPATAIKFNVSADAIRSRAKRCKWRKIPDGRALAKLDVKASSHLVATGGNLSEVIGAHRAKVFEKISGAMDRARPAIRNMKDFDIADKVVRRSLGIDDEKPQQSVLIHLNEAIDDHEAQPIEAHEVVTLLPCNTEPQDQGSSESGQQVVRPCDQPAPSR